MDLVVNIRYRHINEKNTMVRVNTLSVTVNEKQIVEIIATFFFFFSLFIYLIIYRNNFNFNFEEDDL